MIRGYDMPIKVSVENGKMIVQMVECQQCGWLGPENAMSAMTSDMEPGCPSCYGTDFMEVNE